MNKYFIIASMALICSFFLRSDLVAPPFSESSVNALPQISITGTEIVGSMNAVKITYNLSDAENEPCRISLKISNDSGKTFLYPADSISGDAGFPVTPGNNKQIYWYYTTFPSGFSAKVIADDLQPVNIQEVVNQTDSNSLKSSLQSIVGVRHRSAGIVQLQRVKDTIISRFVKYNLKTSVQNFDYSGYNAQNFLGRLQGTTREDTTYIIDGHYETVSVSPGADDNGTAVAAMLEAARILSNYNFRNTIKFIGFDLEESGLIGSSRYVSQGIPSFEKIAGVINSEMIGYYCDAVNCQQIPSGFCTLFPAVCDSINSQQGRGNFLMNVANVNSNSLRFAFDSCARLYVPELRVISLSAPGNGTSTPDLRRSDHAPFWDAGYKALMLTDGANFRNTNYHTANDTYQTINFKFLTENVKAIIAAVASLAGIQHSSFSVSGYFNPNGISQISTEIPEQFSLGQNYPNPFNPVTIINFGIPLSAHVKLAVYDVLGRQVSLVADGNFIAGNYSVDYNASDLPSGVYFYTLKANDFFDTKRMVLVK